MGGTVPFGYRVEKRKLIVEESEAATIRIIFDRFLAIGSATMLGGNSMPRVLPAAQANRSTRACFTSCSITGSISARPSTRASAIPASTRYHHKRPLGQGPFDPFRSPRKRAGQSRRQTSALLKGLIFAPNGMAMTPTHTRNHGRLYRYYVTTSVLRLGPDTCPIKRMPAAEIEAAVIDQLRVLLRSPEMIVKTWMAAREEDGEISESEVREALVQLDPLWGQLFPAEQARVVQLLVERVDVDVEGVSIRLRTNGIGSVVSELRRRPELSRAA